MNLAEFSINKKVITYTLTVVALYVGYLSFNSLPRLEDPEFAIKQALIITSYPGASAREVEKEVTEVIEKAAQEMGQLKFVESWSERGLSKVKVWIKDSYRINDLPQVWDELRRKIGTYGYKRVGHYKGDAIYFPEELELPEDIPLEMAK